MAHPTAVINVVGLDTALLEAAPRLRQRAAGGRLVRLKPVLPAVTCPVQASMLTGLAPSGHGVVANGWYHRELAEVHFWKQSNRLVRGQKVWEAARLRDPSITCANLFWWFNMYSTVDYSVTPRPIYTADGRKIPDCYSQPAELRDELQAKLGQFPLFRFWGPASDITSSRWIARAAQHVHAKYRPTLMLVYLPHLDYALQKLGPMHGAIPRAVAEVDEVAGELLDYLDEQRVRVIVVSEYGIEPVDGAVMVNRVLRDAGLLRVRRERGRELLDAGASSAFAVADHQAAHVYVKEARDIERVASLCAGIAGVEQVLDRRAQKGQGIDHERSGELVLVAQQGRWFAYDYWLDDAHAPDFARTVDIHRKPGYDPRELFIDPAIRWPRAAVAWRLLKKSLGFRTLMDVIPLEASLVKGSHGRTDLPGQMGPVMILPPGVAQHIAADAADAGDASDAGGSLPCTAVRDVILASLFENGK